MRRLLLGIAILVALVGGFVLQLAWVTGEFKTLEPHFEGACVSVGGATGAEDVTIHPRTGVAYVSAADRRAVFAGRPAEGAIYSYDLNSAAPRLIDRTPDAGPDFAPHGISLWVDPDGRDVLYAINHAGGRHTVEVYDLVDDDLIHRETLADPLVKTPNDLVAVGRDRLYVTNDHANTEGIALTLENYLRRAISTVVYWDGARWSIAASGIRYPNGINASADGDEVYVASLTGGEILVFDRDRATGALERRGAIDLGTGVDNIERDARGDLWVGAHAKLLTLVGHAGDPNQPSPSQVLRVRSPGAEDAAVEEVFLSLGGDLSGSSVAAVHGDRLLIGSVLEGMLDCRLAE